MTESVPIDRIVPPEIPDSVPCPCGSGSATLRPAYLVTPYSRDSSRQLSYFNYRHSGCAIGGTIVLLDGEETSKVLRRAGPLFDPARFGGVEAPPSSPALLEPTTEPEVLADGGEVVDGV